MVDLCHDIKRAFPHLADTLIEYFLEENALLRLLRNLYIFWDMRSAIKEVYVGD